MKRATFAWPFLAAGFSLVPGAVVVVVAAFLGASPGAQRAVAGLALERPAFTNFDARLSGKPASPPPLEPRRAAALAQARARIPDLKVDFDEIVVSPKWIRSEKGFLTLPELPHGIGLGGIVAPTAPAAQDPYRQVKQFIDEHAELFGHGSEVLTNARVVREFVTPHSGLRTVAWHQQLDGVPIFEAVLIAHISAKGELVALSSQFLPAPEQASRLSVSGRQALLRDPPVSAAQAVAVAGASVGLVLTPAGLTALDQAPHGSERFQEFTAERLSGPARASLVWLPMDRSTLRLSWKVECTGRQSGETYLVLVDSLNGEMLFRHCLTVYDAATYRVFTSDSPSPFSPGHPDPSTEQPPIVERELLTLEALSHEASPLGWINPGDWETIGNNVDAHRDWWAVNPEYRQDEGDPGLRPGSTDRVFDFPLDLNGDPQWDYSDASVVQLFYRCNWMHDVLYGLGFTEAAGNFQFDNFGRGGVGGDPLLADAQDELVWNNARITVYPQDGYSARIEMGLFDGPQPTRDSSLDSEIIIHEYTHGLSIRRVGAGTGITTTQSRGLGEGWSDFMALALLSEPQDDLAWNYAFGGYCAYNLHGLQQNYYFGVRHYPYTTNLAKNPYTFKDIDPGQMDPHEGVPRSPILGPNPGEVHQQGEVWCVTLWDARARLIGRRGFPEGNKRALRLVVDGMNLAPPNPTFIQARDAILLADRVAYEGQDLDDLWAAFAKRGFGYSAAAPGSETTVGVVEAFDLPPQSPELWTCQAGGAVMSSPALGPDGTIYFGAFDGRLYALNRDGSQRWVFDAGPGVYGQFVASPAVGPDGCIYIPRFDNKLYAVHPDGKLKWTFTAGGLIFSSPAIAADGTVYFGAYDGNVYAVNPDGSLKWRYSTGGIVCSSPSVDRYGVVYVGSFDGRVYALNPDGTLLWASSAAVGPIYSSPAIAPKQEQVYVGSYDGKVYGIGRSDGDIRWGYPTGGAIQSSPALDIEGNVYVGSSDGRLYSLRPDGTLRWTLQTGGAVASSPAIGWDGRVYFGSYDRRLYMARTNGAVLDSFLTGGALFSSPVVGADGRVYIGSLEGRLYAYPAETLLVPSAWPMFRNDPRHLANQALIRMEGGALLPLGGFRFSMYATGFPFPVPRDEAELCDLEVSGDLVNWSLLARLVFARNAWHLVEHAGASEWGVAFYRTKAQETGFPRSRNPYGLVRLSVPPGASMISNPLNTAANTLNGLLPDVPEGTVFCKWNPETQNYDVSTFGGGYGWLPDFLLLPGEGGFIVNPSEQPFTFTIIGEVLQGHLVKPLPTGLSLIGSLVPQQGGITTVLDFGPEDGLATGDSLYRWDNGSGSYEVYSYESGVGWFRVSPPPTVPMEPQLGVGEAFWFNAGGPRTWTRSYSVWP